MPLVINTDYLWCCNVNECLKNYYWIHIVKFLIKILSLHLSLSFTHTFGMCFWLLVWFVMWHLAFCGRQLHYFHGPYLRSVSLLAITETFRCAGALQLNNHKVFQCPGCKVSFFCFCYMNKYDSRSQKCMFLSLSTIASSRVCWGV